MHAKTGKGSTGNASSNVTSNSGTEIVMNGISGSGIRGYGRWRTEIEMRGKPEEDNTML